MEGGAGGPGRGGRGTCTRSTFLDRHRRLVGETSPAGTRTHATEAQAGIARLTGDNIDPRRTRRFVTCASWCSSRLPWIGRGGQRGAGEGGRGLLSSPWCGVSSRREMRCGVAGCGAKRFMSSRRSCAAGLYRGWTARVATCSTACFPCSLWTTSQIRALSPPRISPVRPGSTRKHS